jgi:hypothetical protein
VFSPPWGAPDAASDGAPLGGVVKNYFFSYKSLSSICHIKNIHLKYNHFCPSTGSGQ